MRKNKKMNQDSLILSNNILLVRVHYYDIAYIKSEGSYSTMILINGKKHVFSFNLSSFEKQIESQLGRDSQIFIRLGKSLIINSNYIYCIDITQQKIILLSSKTNQEFSLSASRDALKTLKKILETNTNRRLRI